MISNGFQRFSMAAYLLKALAGRPPMQNRRSAEAAVAHKLRMMCGVCVLWVVCCLCCVDVHASCVLRMSFNIFNDFVDF